MLPVENLNVLIQMIRTRAWHVGVLLIVAFQSHPALVESSKVDTGIYGAVLRRDWLNDSKSISIQVEGCVWGYTADSNQANMGCLENSSEDGTTVWYKMANCRRAQVAYSVYASSSGSTTCSNGDYKETLVTKDGLAEFAYAMGNYASNSPISSNDVYNLPLCEYDGSGYYLSVGCTSSGSFTIDRFTDQYCLSYKDTYDSLKNLNSVMSKLQNCFSCFSSSSDAYGSLCSYLIANSGGCSQYDSPICKTSSFIKNAGSTSSLSMQSIDFSNSSLPNKLKYGAGGLMLFGAIAMFIGILFTNRRKRRAMMHRKFKESVDKKRTKSKSKSRRSQSRRRESNTDGEDGVWA